MHEPDLSNPAARLRWARVRAGYPDAKAFADVVGLKPVTYRAYETGQNGYADLAPHFAAKLGVSTDWLLGGGEQPTGEIPTIDRAPDRLPTRDASANDDAVDVKVLDLSLPMGPGAEIDDYVEESTMKMDIGLLRTLTHSPFERLRILKGIGDSMTPTIRDGDLVIIDLSYAQLDFEDKIWACRIRGKGAVKRLRSAPKSRVRIISDNATVPNDAVDESELVILGRVICSIRSH